MTDFHCSFCGASRLTVPKLIAGPMIFICTPCVAAAAGVLATAKDRGQLIEYPVSLDGKSLALDGPVDVAFHPRRGLEPGATICGFCGKLAAEVAALVGHGTTRICEECIDLCADIAAAG